MSSALSWRKSSYSGGSGGDCVELAGQGGHVLVRDSKDATGPVLRLSPSAWRELTARLKGR